MNTYKLLLAGLAALSLSFAAQALPFMNLGFESANLSPVPAGQSGGEVSSLDAIPSWTASLGGSTITQIRQNSLTLGDASVDILGPDWNFFGIIQGQYMVVLQPGAGQNADGSFGNVSASISQTGLVPPNTQSLEFKAQINSLFSLSLGGQDLSLVPLGTGSTTTSPYTIYGADIPVSDTGQTETLTITALAAPNTADYFDSFVFSPSSVPEPTAWTLLLCGAGLLGVGRKLCKRK